MFYPLEKNVLLTDFTPKERVLKIKYHEEIHSFLAGENESEVKSLECILELADEQKAFFEFAE